MNETKNRNLNRNYKWNMNFKQLKRRRFQNNNDTQIKK